MADGGRSTEEQSDPRLLFLPSLLSSMATESAFLVGDNGKSQKTVSVDVDYSSDMWMVVRYEDETGETYQGILLKTPKTGDHLSSSASVCPVGPNITNSESRKRGKDREMPSLRQDGMQESLLASESSPQSPTCPMLDPRKVSCVALRRTMSNGGSRKISDLILGNTKPALGIRRLENRSVRLRPTSSQRNAVLCAKCQEQCVVPSRRLVATNGNVDRTRNGVVSNCTSPIVNDGNCSSMPCKRRSSEVTECRSSTTPGNNNTNSSKKTKLRNGGLMAAAEGGNATLAALPSASNVLTMSSEQEPAGKLVRNSDSTGSSSDAKNSSPRVPKLKISFGNNEEKTTTIITLPPSYSESTEECFGGNEEAKSDGKNGDNQTKNGYPVVINNEGGGRFDDSEDTVLPGGLRVGDIVWAKMQSSPFWPAKIFSANNRAACVTWCGSKQYGFVEFKAMERFKETFHKRYNPKRTNNNYQKAVAEAIVKNSGGDGDSMDEKDTYYYQHLISSSCWKYLTGARNPVAKARTARKNGRRMRSRNGSVQPKSRSRVNSGRGMDGLEAESVTSPSSVGSPYSTSTMSLDWQPRVLIGPMEQVVAESSRRKAQKPVKIKQEVVEFIPQEKPLSASGKKPILENRRKPAVEQQRKPALKHQRKLVLEHQRKPILEHQRKSVLEHQRKSILEHQRKPILVHQRKPILEHQRKPILERQPNPVLEHRGKPVLEFRGKPVFEARFDPQGVNRNDQITPFSPLPVERSEDDDDDDEDRLQIDEAAHLDDDDELDQRVDQPSIASNVTIPGNDCTYRLTSTSMNDDETMVRQEVVQQDPQGPTAQGPPPPRARVGESQDDFESALTELQEMNEMCAGTSVLAQC